MRTSLLIFLACLALPAAGAERVGSRDRLWNVRYGEILLVTGGPLAFTGHVYNTLGLNDCPEAEWKALDPRKLKKQFKARTVILNGPRYFLMDKNTLANPGKVATFGGLEARHLADVDIPLTVLLRGKSKPYTENTVKRTSEYIFRKGRTIYELTSPAGARYVMQSYSQMIDPSLTEPDLAALGSRLQLPPGWRYRAIKLDRDLVLRASGTAHVLQDELQNSYQRR